MRILLLHPADDPEHGPWIYESWDRIVDLGCAGQTTRGRWSAFFRCAVESLPNFETCDFAKVRRILFHGLGRATDQHGLDWWELISTRLHEHVELTVRLRKFTSSLPAEGEVFVTRWGIHAQLSTILLGRPIHCLESKQYKFARVRHTVDRLLGLVPSQFLQTLGDKYDAGYRFRGLFWRKPATVEGDVVLLPVAHVNAARMALAYSAMLPHRKFLLIATRQSGWITPRPRNVAGARLSAYAQPEVDDSEYRQLLASLRQLQTDSAGPSQIAVLARIGLFSKLPELLRDGLAIRNAWIRVLNSEPVSAVFCTDDTNPYTHIPLLLARKRALPTLACHHGALDGGSLVKKRHADFVLAKGTMEWDYLVNACAIPPEKVQSGGHLVPLKCRCNSAHNKSAIIFFSEPYELDYGRASAIYGEVLPRLAALASRMDCELVLKLHPMEGFRERRKLLDEVLSVQNTKTRIVTGVLSEELLDRAAFAVTIQSTAAVDCTIRGIPTFLCGWLNYSHYGYLEQFIRFGAGTPLYSPSEIDNIPELLRSVSEERISNLWRSIAPEELDQLLAGPLKMAAAV